MVDYYLYCGTLHQCGLHSVPACNQRLEYVRKHIAAIALLRVVFLSWFFNYCNAICFINFLQYADVHILNISPPIARNLNEIPQVNTDKNCAHIQLPSCE